MKIEPKPFSTQDNIQHYKSENTSYYNNMINSFNYKLNNNRYSSPSYPEVYERKEFLITKNELKFYKLLLSIVDIMELQIFTQVSLYEIISVKKTLNSSEYNKYFNKIKSKSIDYVLTDRMSRIKLCIELDDKTHNYKNRIERDNFINDLFNSLDIPILRIQLSKYYDMDNIKKTIINLLNSWEIRNKNQNI